MRHLFILSIFICARVAYAGSWVINPSDDGYIYSGSSGISVTTFSYLQCYTGMYNNMRGIAEFPLVSVSGTIESATLSVNPYGLPLWNPTMHVYGYASTDGMLTSSDYSAGTFLGDWTLPSLTHGQDAYFDVTGFVKTVSTSYVGFNLRVDSSIGVNQFSSLEYNYGHPAQLSITTVPEPATLLLLGLGATMVRKRKG